MAIPRIFVSSTCYDLYDLRNNLRNFIKTFEYEPVMSEFGDIFYDYNLHVQDACLKEIDNCQMFILIVGNNYGSTYYKNKSSDKTPTSVTLAEFKKALSSNIARHIFINRFVKYDYDNYRRFLVQKYSEYFNSNSVPEPDIQKVKENIKNKVDSDYPFSHDSYKHIFKFFDVISELNMNNAILTFETSTDIQEQLKKQWAGFFYDGLLNYKKESSNNSKDINNEVILKIDKIEKLIGALLKEDKQNGKISIDINNYKNAINYSEIEQYQDIFQKTVNELLFNEHSNYDDNRRGKFTEKITEDATILWMNSLENILQKNVWSKTIPFLTVFNTFKCEQFEEDAYIPYKALLSFYNLYHRIEDNQRNSFIESLAERLRKLEDGEINAPEEAAFTIEEDEDLPF